LTVAHIESPLAAVWREHRHNWQLTVTFMPGVEQGLRRLLGLRSDDSLWTYWQNCVPRHGIDCPAGGRPDVSLWVTLDALAGHDGEAHLALVADPPRLWAERSMFAVGFVADATLALPAPDWLGDPSVPMPSISELGAASSEPETAATSDPG
jgi:hypothetical protein